MTAHHAASWFSIFIALLAIFGAYDKFKYAVPALMAINIVNVVFCALMFFGAFA